MWSDLKQSGDGLLKARTTADQLGRPVLSESSENGSTYTISSRSVYQQMGRITFHSNPTRNSGESTDGWTRTTSDDIGRVIEVASFNGAAQPPSSGTNSSWTGSVLTSYNAEQTTVTDQAGKSRSSIVDGLGRLKTVIEDPGSSPHLNHQTNYSYDVLSNLTQVNQGVQVRQFAYDSLSRLKTAKNPEQVNGSGTMIATAFLYDDASNLLRKTNPNGTTVSFTYDGFNRAKAKTLSTGSWTYLYDTGTNFKGRMVKETLDGSTPGDGNYNDGYDAMGRVTSSHQVTTVNGAAQTYNVSYKYDLAGNVTSQTYPSGKEYRTSFDNAGRVASASRYISGALDKTYVSNLSYGAQGAVTAMKLGNLKWEHTVYNGRLQPVEMGLGTSSIDSSSFKLQYTFGVRVGGVLDLTKNNGNVESQATTAPLNGGGNATFTQSYVYDELNRLSGASEGANWSQSYAYDRYGNRALSSGYIVPGNEGLTPRTVGSPGDDINPATNRIVACLYDTSGNVTADQLGRSFTYDSENHQLSFNGSAGQYRYDCDGRRVLKTDATGTVVFVYNAGGQLLAEYTTGVVQNNGTSYLTTDHLGSTRVVTDVNGGVRSRHDYLPYGEEIPSTVGRSNVANYGVTDGVRQKYTQKERDGESGLDYFGARYYSSAQGRFTSVDPGMESAVLTQPQSWNRYEYVLNNPLTIIDPDGRAWIEKGDGTLGWDGSIDENDPLADLKAKAIYGLSARVLRSGTIRIITAAPKGSPWAALIGREVVLTSGGVMLDLGPERRVSPEEINFWDGYGQQFLGAYLKEAAINVIGALTGAAAVRAIEYVAEAARATKVVGSTLKILQNLCFVAGTKIITSAQSRPIEELKPGDEVLAGDTECGALTYKRVISATASNASSVVDIYVEGVTITCTPEHPLWAVGEGWTEAGRLTVGTVLLVKGGSGVRVESVNRRDGSFKGFNLEVEDVHTYFVSDLGVLAHNSCRISPLAGDWATKGCNYVRLEGTGQYLRSLVRENPTWEGLASRRVASPWEAAGTLASKRASKHAATQRTPSRRESPCRADCVAVDSPAWMKRAPNLKSGPLDSRPGALPAGWACSCSDWQCRSPEVT